MMNLGELVGGIGVSMMIFKTDFERAVADMGAALDATSAKLSKLQKLAQGDDLRKSTFSHKAAMAHLNELKTMLDGVNDDLRELNKIADRRRAALPGFELWLSGKPPPTRATSGPLRDYGSFAASNKVVGHEHGAELTELSMPSQKPTVDPTKNVADAMLARRFQGGQP